MDKDGVIRLPPVMQTAHLMIINEVSTEQMDKVIAQTLKRCDEMFNDKRFDTKVEDWKSLGIDNGAGLGLSLLR